MVFLSLVFQTNGARFITSSYTTIAMPVLRVKSDKGFTKVSDVALLVHPVFRSIGTRVDAVVLFDDFRIFCHTHTQLGCRGTVPVGSRKQANAYSQGSANLRASEGKAGWEVIRDCSE